MKKPPNVAQAYERNLAAESNKGILTFSNGSSWESWFYENCQGCLYYDPDSVGPCAFEALAYIGAVSPALARLFGWKERSGEPGWFNPPQECAFLEARLDDSGNPRTPPPDPDPSQVDLFADGGG